MSSSTLDEVAQVRLLLFFPHIHENATLTIDPGNITSSSTKETRRPSYSADSQTFRQGFGTRRFSTGIGGSGNITTASQLEKQSEAEETSRLLYDMQAPGIVLVDEGYHTGRGRFYVLLRQ